MEDNNIHSKIINQVCREVLIPLGVFQKGASRLYLDDNDYFFTVIEFQPSTWSKGTYLNIGLTFLWNYNQSDVLSFAFSRQPAARYGKFVEYKNETQFRKDVTSLVNIARDEILFYRSFRRIEFAKDWMIAYIKGFSDNKYAKFGLDIANICVLDNDTETGLYYLNSRYYDPSIGRFLNADDISYIHPTDINGLKSERNARSVGRPNGWSNTRLLGISWVDGKFQDEEKIV